MPPAEGAAADDEANWTFTEWTTTERPLLMSGMSCPRLKFLAVAVLPAAVETLETMTESQTRFFPWPLCFLPFWEVFGGMTKRNERWTVRGSLVYLARNRKSVQAVSLHCLRMEPVHRKAVSKGRYPHNEQGCDREE